MEQNTFCERPRLTFEVFIPERGEPHFKLQRTMEALGDAQPDCILATADHRHCMGLERAVEFAAEMQNDYGIPGAVLIPSICYTRPRLQLQLRQMQNRGISRILAIRGDGMQPDFEHADFPGPTELIEFIREQGKFEFVSACFPENHPESQGIVTDVWQLRRQAEAGAIRILTRSFYSFRYFESVQERLHVAEVMLPMDAGILPVLRKEAVEVLRQDFGVRLPRSFAKQLEELQDDPQGFYEAGIQYAIEQIRRLVAMDAPGIHIFSHSDPVLIARLSDGYRQAVADYQNGILQLEYPRGT